MILTSTEVKTMTIGENAHARSQLLQVTDCEHDAPNRNENKRIGYLNGKRKLMKAYLYTNQLKKPPRITYSNSTDIIIEHAWCNRVVAKKFHSNSPTNK